MPLGFASRKHGGCAAEIADRKQEMPAAAPRGMKQGGAQGAHILV